MARRNPAAALRLGVLAGPLALISCGVFALAAETQSREPGRPATIPGIELHHPEEREWLKEAGAEDALRYAKYLRPNVGLTERELGIPTSRYRQVETRIAAALSARSAQDVATELKRKRVALTPNPLLDKATERANFRRVPFAINSDLADYVLAITDRALKSEGIEAGKGSILRAKAWITGVYYLCAGIEYHAGSKADMDPQVYALKGLFAFDRARGDCTDTAVTFLHILHSKKNLFPISADLYPNRTKFADPRYFAPRGGQFTDHMGCLVKYNAVGKVEGYDATQERKLDSRDPDCAAAWIVSYSGYPVPYKMETVWKGGSIRTSHLPDPFSTLSREGYVSFPQAITLKAHGATAPFRVLPAPVLSDFDPGVLGAEISKWAPGWKFVTSGREMAPGIHASEGKPGEPAFLTLHPASRTEPAALEAKLPLPEGKPVLNLSVRSFAGPPAGADWLLRVRVEGETVLEQVILSPEQWREVPVDLSRWAGRTVTVRIENAAGGPNDWAWEAGYFQPPRLVSR